MIGRVVVGPSLWALQQAAPLNPGEMTQEQFRQQIALEAARRSRPGGDVVAIILSSVIVPLAFFTLVAVLVWLSTRRRQAQIRATAEFHKQLLEKFGSGREFAEFVDSPGGQRFLDEFWSRENRPKEQILKAVRSGVILAVLGLGLFGLAGIDVRLRGSLLILAVPTFSLGVGFLVAAAASHYLFKKWESNPRAGAGSAFAS